MHCATTKTAADPAAGTLELARLSAESLHGADCVQLDVTWWLDRRRGRVEIDNVTQPGRTMALILMGYARREVGRDAVRVSRHLNSNAATRQTAGAAQ